MQHRLPFFLILLIFTPHASYSMDSTQASSAEDTLMDSAPKVFIDCNYCDMDYIRTEVTFVNYVRDRKDAQVHVLITTQSTGARGTEYTLLFSCQGEFEGTDNELKYVSGNTDTSDEIREGLVDTLKIGLVPYAGKTPIAERISISYRGNVEDQPSTSDKWDYWVFSVGGRGYFNGEKRSSYYSLSANFSANRVTPESKFRVSYSGSRSVDSYTYADVTRDIVSKSHNFNLLAVKSISTHWSIGAGLSANSSTYSNISFAVKPAPAVEYNFFPYSESTRKQLRFLWKPGFSSYHYREETIYDKTSENLWGESFTITLELKQKWGTVTNAFEASHYFSDFSKNRLYIYGDLSIRLLKGLSFTTYGRYSRIRDQLSLVKGNLTLEDVLLQRKQLETGYSYYFSIGFSYTFGSIYSHVVNPRFDGY
ncbi:MAG: hypothetical protein JXR49_23270 [Acidobacteria bacterium]|nr:hypothetical protein [Acidobacteriota bacterium]